MTGPHQHEHEHEHEHEHGHGHGHGHGGSDGDGVDEAQWSEEHWDERYRSATAVWSGRPNPQLVAEVAGLAPGTALDAGTGEGADALWLAERGWRVTAVDISTVALGRAAATAQRAGAQVAERITWQQEDLLAWEPPPGAFDLVSAQFLHLPPRRRAQVHARLAAGVAPGGVLLVVSHSRLDLATTARRPAVAELFATAGEIAAGLDPAAWEVLVSEARPRTAADPDGQTITVRDEVLTARRRVSG